MLAPSKYKINSLFVFKTCNILKPSLNSTVSQSVDGSISLPFISKFFVFFKHVQIIPFSLLFSVIPFSLLFSDLQILLFLYNIASNFSLFSFSYIFQSFYIFFTKNIVFILFYFFIFFALNC
jgi:hypothetical protein